MSILDYHAVEPVDHSEAYKRFVCQMSKWYDGGELPELAGQDLRFVLELQRQKLQALGLDMQCTLKKKAWNAPDIISSSYSDRIFTNSFISGNLFLTRSISSTQKHPYTEEFYLLAVIQDLKGGVQPSAKMAFCCPHCGAPSTLGELEDGCEFCGTQFMMSDLYPKVMNDFMVHREDRDKSSARNKRDLASLITAFSLVMIPFVIIAKILVARYEGKSPNMIELVSSGILSSIFSGAMLGGIVFLFKKLFEVLGLMGKQARGIGHTASTLFYANKIKNHDPEFSAEYLRDKIMSLFRMAVYSQEAAELAVCRCQCPKKAADIIEAQLHNYNINRLRYKDMVCDVEVTLFLDCLHYRKGKIRNKTDKFRMKLRKRLKNPTELGFSFAAVSCPSCGASFDARNVKACPYCNKAYVHEEHDWIIMDIK